jgi:hypothetical protein
MRPTSEFHMEARALLEQQGDELERLRQQALERDLGSDPQRPFCERSGVH